MNYVSLLYTYNYYNYTTYILLYSMDRGVL